MKGGTDQSKASRRFAANVTRGVMALFVTVSMSGCMNAYRKSVGGDTEQIFSRIFLTEFNVAWQSALDALKRSPLEITDREAGFIRTKYVDNTAVRNLVESFGPSKAYLKAQYRVSVTVAKGYYNGTNSVKVTVLKEQLVQSDVLEGWRPVVSDSVDENTLLYRIGRIIQIRMELAALEEQRAQKAFGTEPK
ncbi:MAG: hypothetical protein AB7P04_01025 [Bacteriovoracia bacterium]